MTTKLDPENDEGSTEYKLKLTMVDRVEQIATQMRYRVDEGNGEAIYTLGVMDDGAVIGLLPEEFQQTINILETAAKKNNYKLFPLAEKNVDEGKKMYEFLVREVNPAKYIDIKVACAGNVDAGKSSLLGVLLTGKNDNGRGSSRLEVFNFQHEIKSGQTSSVAHHIMGFDKDGKIVNYSDEHGRKKSWPEIVAKSVKIISFFDLCGHEKYLKTTIVGLTSSCPDIVIILVGGNMGINKMTKEHIYLCLSLKIPFLVVITKIDICKERENVLKDTIDEIKKLLRLPGIRRIPFDVKTDEDTLIAAKNIDTFSTVPIFQVSNVTGEGLDTLRLFLNVYNKKLKISEVTSHVEYHVEHIFQVPGVGVVLGGQLIKGKICVNDKFFLGPNSNSYQKVQVKSIHCKKIPVQEVDCGRYVCVALRKVDKNLIRRGNVLLSMADSPIQVWEFDAEVMILKAHSTMIKVGYEPILHTGSIRQAARIVSITNKQCSRNVENESDMADAILRSGDRAIVHFRFCYHPEFMRKDFRLLMAEGRVKVIGKVISVAELRIDV